MNDHKISFIICWNNEFYMHECMTYLSELIIPEGYEVDIVEVTGAKSMTAGCNEGMRRSDAKYKIYMHQDVFITNKNFLSDLLQVFGQDDNIGLIGMVGTPYMIKTGTMWQGVRFGGFYKLQENIEKDIVHRFFPFTTGYMEMEAVDGLLLATQYDLPWREDIFTKWDFYDVSQSFEFRKQGYKVVVPVQLFPWYKHREEVPNIENYHDERQKFLEVYAEFISGRQKETWDDYLVMLRKRMQECFYGEEEEKKQLIGLLAGLSDD